MISVADAVALATSGLDRLPIEVISVREAHGRILAENLQARRTQPPVTVSAMDGYAVHLGTGECPPTAWRIIGEALPGSAVAQPLADGEALRIFTGSPLPEGAEAIVIQEEAEVSGDRLRATLAPTRGRWIRAAGLDFHVGDALLDEGRLLTARDVGLISAMNIPWIKVRQRPRVAILATGDELAAPGDPLPPTGSIDAGSFMIASLIEAWGGSAIVLGVAPDDMEMTRRLVDAAAGADLLVTMGGSSVGARDRIHELLQERATELVFHRVAMRPGKPLGLGRLGTLRLLALPGNPVSIGVTAHVFLKPMIAALLGATDLLEKRATARLGRDLDGNDSRQDYLRATLATGQDGALVATPFTTQDSAMLRTFAASDCLVVRPPHAPAVRAGEVVDILLLE